MVDIYMYMYTHCGCRFGYVLYLSPDLSVLAYYIAGSLFSLFSVYTLLCMLLFRCMAVEVHVFYMLNVLPTLYVE